MIAQCDNPDCATEWFHFECVGLTRKPQGKTGTVATAAGQIIHESSVCNKFPEHDFV